MEDCQPVPEHSSEITKIQVYAIINHNNKELKTVKKLLPPGLLASCRMVNFQGYTPPA